ncbi:MAG: DUF350 domain-containing protein [Planctomycetota bacterium]
MFQLLLADSVKQMVNLNDIVNALVYTGLGVVVFGAAFLIMIMVMPFSVRKEIEEDQNTSLGIIMGSVVIGLAIIIAAAVHG